jgi:hypothetical protein
MEKYIRIFSYVALATTFLAITSCKKTPYYFSFGKTNPVAHAAVAPDNTVLEANAGSEPAYLLPAKQVEKPSQKSVNEQPVEFQTKKQLKKSAKEIFPEVKKSQKRPVTKVKENGGDRSQTIAFLLALIPAIFGVCGIQRFYLGGGNNIIIGIVQLLTLGCCGIWQLVDIIRIAVGELTPPNGEYTDKW